MLGSGTGVMAGRQVESETTVRIGINAHKLAFDATYRQAGVSRYVEALLMELPAVAPDDVFVAFTGPDGIHQRKAFDERITWVPSRFSTVRPPARILWEQTAGQLVGRRHGLDLLHAPVNVVPLLPTGRQVVTVHDLAFEHYPEQYPAAQQRYLHLMTRLSVRRASRVIAVSESTRRDLLDLYGCPEDRVVVVPNGVDDSYCPRPERDDAEFRRQQDLPERYILFVGTLQPRKNLETLLRAYAMVASALDWPLVIVGSTGWMYESIFALVRRLGLGNQVRFAGYVPVDDLPRWYSAATIFVLPSLYEGFGIPALEAMACGTAVVVSNTSSLPEVVGDAGVTVDPQRARSIATRILALAEDPGYRQELEQRGQCRAQGYRWRRTAEATYDVYRAVAGIGSE